MGLEIAQSLTVLACGKCGIAYAVPSHWFESRKLDRDDDEEDYDEEDVGVHCPNGHRRVYYRSSDQAATPEQVAELKAENARLSKLLRQHEMQKLHEREQAEARIAEGKEQQAPARRTPKKGR